MGCHARQGWWTTWPAGAAALLLLCALIALIPAAPAGAQDAPAGAAPSAAAVTLAERYAPVVRLQERPGDGRCRDGEPYEPVDVRTLFDNEEVALRGPWDRTNVVDVGPSAERVSGGLWGYHLDFPGDPLDPGCGYAEWADRISEGTPPDEEETMGDAERDTDQGRPASELIDERIAGLGDWRGEVLARMRALVHETLPDVQETWKWRGVPVWEHGGIICTGESYRDKLKLTFHRGASLDDPAGLFNASLDGNARRAIDIAEGDEVDAEAFRALVRAAAEANAARRST